MMNALILAAGMGTRLRPLTDTVPKALVPLGGKPMLEHLMLKLKAAGFEHIVVNVHYLGGQIVDFLEKKHSFGLQVEISDERGHLLNTGGALRKASRFFTDDQPVLVHNADIVSNHDLMALMQKACRLKSDALLMTSRRKSSRLLCFDEKMRLRGWQNLKTGETASSLSGTDLSSFRSLAFDGIHVISSRLLRAMEREQEEAFSLFSYYLRVASSYDIRGYLPQETIPWADAGTPETLAEAEAIVTERSESTPLKKLR